ncbi:bifunctional peptidase and (3S)-lysyl hydroxylase Jmjd7-like [Ptychodera flava]|uniref:bifunctional peptidase and (3S)-lysyl hydroxylase Jmjd7-like n=1 Tax=Ptychodera flava TaxID=63121 RepID=UPI00396A1887
MLDFVNSKCGTYRNANGHVSVEGLHKEDILNNIFRVSDISNCTSGMAFKEKFETCGRRGSSNCKKCDGEDDGVATETASLYLGDRTKMPECERIAMPTRDDFFNDFLKRSKPVIITDAMQNWDAIEKWKNEFLRKEYGKKKIHIKLAPNGEFEGCEPSRIWEDSRSFKIPQQVRDQLPFPDLVVVRPATMNLKFSDFLDMVENATLKKNNVSAYLEYSSIPQYMPELEKDIQEFPFVKGMLTRKHLNLWISDGNTLGKLHFDPFDNFLCMISGKKQLIIFEPHENHKLYEAHIPEAILDYQPETGKFRRKRLLDSTSMVMSPVDILDPDFKRFPEFSKTYPLNCTISEGEVLFMPAFWWHEVQSFPSLTENRNVAVNFWYEPFLTKDFPCPGCTLDVNPKYSHLL